MKRAQDQKDIALLLFLASARRGRATRADEMMPCNLQKKGACFGVRAHPLDAGVYMFEFFDCNCSFAGQEVHHFFLIKFLSG